MTPEIANSPCRSTATSAQADPGPTEPDLPSPSRRRIIVVDEPADAIRAAIRANLGAGVEVSTAPKAPAPPPPVPARRWYHYPAGQKLQASDGTLYQVDPCGAFRRLSPKPLSKKERRRQRRNR